MKKQCLNCGSMVLNEISTCPTCHLTGHFRAVEEELKNPSSMIKKSPSGNCHNCNLPIMGEGHDKCPHCKISLNKERDAIVNPGDNGILSRNYTSFLSNFSLT